MSGKKNTPENNKKPLLQRSGFESFKYFISSLKEEDPINKNYKKQNLSNAIEYISELELPDGFQFILYENGEAVFVLEPEDNKTLPEQVDEFNEAWFKQGKVYGDPSLKQIRKYNKEIEQKTHNCQVKATPGDSLKKEYLKVRSIDESFKHWAELTPETVIDRFKMDAIEPEVLKHRLHDFYISKMKGRDTMNSEERKYITEAYEAMHDHFDNLQYLLKNKS